MKFTTFTLLAAACALLQGCFFFVIPGSVTGKISDAITGAKGANCVGASAKVGDRIRLPDSSLLTIKSLSGTSDRCTVPQYPIRAELVASTDLAASPAPSPYVSNLRLNLPVGWESKPMPENLAKSGWFVYAVNRNTEVYATLTATKHEGITDMLAYAQTRRAALIGNLTDAVPSVISQVEINGRRAFRGTVTGKVKTGQTITYLGTVIEGPQEIAVLLTWTFPANFGQQKDAMGQLAEDVVGF
jgi:hypothetical protein